MHSQIPFLIFVSNNKINIMKCLKCDYNVEDLVNWDTLCEDYIECPNCSNKMTVEYDEYEYDDGEYSYSWWLEQYF